MTSIGRSGHYRHAPSERLAGHLQGFSTALLAPQDQRQHRWMHAREERSARPTDKHDKHTCISMTASGSGSRSCRSASDQRQAFAYMPYGFHALAATWRSLPGFKGSLAEALSGHHLLGNGYRAYNPVLMRFNSPDNMSPFGEGGVNAYAYCSADPVNRTDTSGHIGVRLAVVRYKHAKPWQALKNALKTKHATNPTSDEPFLRAVKTVIGAHGATQLQSPVLSDRPSFKSEPAAPPPALPPRHQSPTSSAARTQDGPANAYDYAEEPKMLPDRRPAPKTRRKPGAGRLERTDAVQENERHQRDLIPALQHIRQDAPR